MADSKKRVWIFRVAAVVVLVLIAVAMFIIGRGHTVYFDNKALEGVIAEGDLPYKIEVVVGGEKVASIKAGERGMVETMGQNFKMQLLVTQEKGGKTSKVQVGLPLPYRMDGIILNLPAMLAGKTPDVYLSEFIATPSTDEMEDEEVITDETEGLMDFGE